MLLKNQKDALLYGRRTAAEESRLISEAAYDEAEEALEEAKEEQSSERDMWPEKIGHLLARIEALVAKGHLVNGPILAWEALEEVVYHSICDYHGRECFIGGWEDDCDGFHEEVDLLALQILVEIKQHNPDSFSASKRSKTIKGWQTRAEDAVRDLKNCEFRTKRYKRSLHFLKTGQILADLARRTVVL